MTRTATMVRQARDAEWHQRRAGAIGGSDAGAVLGVSEKTALRLWKEKRGEIEPEDLDDKQCVYWGSVLETVVAREYERRTGRVTIIKDELSVHPQFPWMVANVDRFVRVPGNARLILEIKTVGMFAFGFGNWGADGSSQVPPSYYAQAQHNIAVTESDQCDMPVLIGGQDYRCYHLPRDDDFIARLIDHERAFVESLYSGEPPKPINAADLDLLFPRAEAATVAQASPQVARAWATHCLWRKRLRNAKRVCEDQELIIKEAMGDSESIQFNGITLATWKNRKKGDGRTFKVKGKGEGWDTDEADARDGYALPDASDNGKDDGEDDST